MNKSVIGASLVVVAVLIVTIISIGANKDTASNNDQTTDIGTANIYSKSEVEKHSSKEDCWTYINGIVYDLTAYIPRHVGGDEILRACGADGTTLFASRTTESGEKVGSGTPHSSSAESQLAKLKIGTLE